MGEVICCGIRILRKLQGYFGIEFGHPILLFFGCNILNLLSPRQVYMSESLQLYQRTYRQD